MMTKEKLLIPRYRVLGPFPGSPFDVGQIIEGRDSFGTLSPEKFEDYPNLFRKLLWYQCRELSDLPQYVRILDHMWKVDRWTNGLLAPVPITESDNVRPLPQNYQLLCVKWNFMDAISEPATTKEYLDFISQPAKPIKIKTPPNPL